MNFFRGITSLPVAAAITIILFIAMAALIAQDAKPQEAKDAPQINILARMIETPVHAPKPPDAKSIDAPPPPDTKWKKTDSGVSDFTLGDPGPLEVDPMEHGPVGVATPLIRVAPQYPESCRARGAEGRVLVQFDVTARGEVTNVRILSSDNRCFDRTVMKTIRGWKYPPEARKGLVETFVFTLT